MTAAAAPSGTARRVLLRCPAPAGLRPTARSRSASTSPGTARCRRRDLIADRRGERPSRARRRRVPDRSEAPRRRRAPRPAGRRRQRHRRRARERQGQAAPALRPAPRPRRRGRGSPGGRRSRGDRRRCAERARRGRRRSTRRSRTGPTGASASASLPSPDRFVAGEETALVQLPERRPGAADLQAAAAVRARGRRRPDARPERRDARAHRADRPPRGRVVPRGRHA